MINPKEKDNKTNKIPEQSMPQIKRKRGGFPRLSLKKTLEVPIAIYKIGQGEPVRRLKVFDQLGKSADSGPSRALVTVSSSYGLTKGGYQAEYLELTDMGKILVVAESPVTKHEIIYKILFGNDIFASFIEYWKNKAVPADDIASDWIIRNHNFVAQDAKAYWDIIKANVFDFYLTEQLSGKQVILPRDAAMEAIKQKLGSSLDEPEILDAQNGIISVFSKGEPSDSIEHKSSALKPGLAGFERNYTYGTARMVFPAKMKQIELDKMKMTIEGLVEVVNE